MKIGDIIFNKNAGDSHPYKYSILIHEGEEYSECLVPYNGKLVACRWYTSDLKKGSTFRKVGHIDLHGIILSEINKLKKLHIKEECEK